MTAKKLDSIYALIPKVMREVGAIGKDGVNTFDKYKFRSIDSVYNALQPVLAKNGVFFIPEVLESHENEVVSGQGKTQVRVKQKIRYKVYAEDGSSIEAVVEGEGIDRSDKATNKAFTAAFKYMLIQVFCIAVEGMDDADKDSPSVNIKEKVEKNSKSVNKNVEKKATSDGDFLVKEGKFANRVFSEIPRRELEVYLSDVTSALKARRKPEPAWFSNLRLAFEEA